MEFTLEMNYNQKSMTAMAKALRKGLQEEQDKRSKLIGWGFIIVAAVIMITSRKFDYRQVIAWGILALFAVYLTFQDHINGFLALRRLPKDLRRGMWLFREDGYFVNAEIGESDFSYENIFAILESEGYIFFVFQNGQAQIMDLSTIQGGTADDFRRLLRRKTSLTIQPL